MRRLLGYCLALATVLLPGPLAARDTPKPAEIKCVKHQPIDTERFVAIGGIEQWVTIRGDDCANPLVLFLHGGPGNPLSPFARNIYAGWEKQFTLVQWDQRGAGKTFGRNPNTASLTIAQMTADGVALAEYLTRAFGQKKIILTGGSWGSVLGIHMAKARPDLFHAYLGVSQLVSNRTNQAAGYRRLRDLARQAGDGATLATLDALGPPPWTNPRNFGAFRRITRKYEARVATPPPPGWWTPAAGYATPAALADYEQGEEFSYIQAVGMAGDGMLSPVHLPSLGTDFRVPIFLLQGAEDLVTVPEVTKAYFDSITAPQKAYRVVPAAGHDPNAALVLAQFEILRSQILPLTR